MPRYLITVTQANAAKLEKWLGSRLIIGRPGQEGVGVASLDAVFSEELTAVDERLRTSGPLYHAGGPR